MGNLFHRLFHTQGHGSVLSGFLIRMSNPAYEDTLTQHSIWLFDLAPSMPPTVQLHGFDISEEQYPPKHMWPENVSLALLDAFRDVPPTLVGQYDVVHVRMWAANIRDGKTGPLISHLQQLLSSAHHPRLVTFI